MERHRVLAVGRQTWPDVPPARRTNTLRQYARDLDETLLGCDSTAARDYHAARTAA